MLQESNPSYLDYRQKNIFVVGAKKKDLSIGDLVVDDSGTIGIVKYKSEKFGNYIEFVDDFSVYDSQIAVKKISSTNEALYAHHKKYFGFITRLGRIILESISDDFPNVNMFNNGKVIYVKGSTLGGIVKKYVSAKVTKSHSYFSVVLTPFFNFKLENLDIKIGNRKSINTYKMLKNLFIDIDLKMKQSNRTKFIINDMNDYNYVHWKKIIKQFKKFQLKYPYEKMSRV